MNNLVTVVATDSRIDKNGRHYNCVTLRAPNNSDEYVNPHTGELYEVLAPAKTVKAIGYKIPYNFESEDTSAIPDYLWAAQPGMVVEGKIITKQVVPYNIGERYCSKATIFIQGQTSNLIEFKEAIITQFEKKGHTLLEETTLIPTTPNHSNRTAQNVNA